MDWLNCYVLYRDPSDYPERWVLRRQRIGSGVVRIDDEPLYVGSSAVEARKLLPAGLSRVQRPGEDPDPKIWEVWA